MMDVGQQGKSGSSRRRPGLSRQFNIYIGPAYVVFAIVMVVAVNASQRSSALEEARQVSRILLDRNLATHSYFSKELKPAVFPLAAKATDEKRYFDPAWMSSTYAVRRIGDYFQQLAKGNAGYYYKECAINARSPENEADAVERAFIEQLRGNPRLTESTAVREIEGKRFLVVLRRGETMEKECLRCHSVPEAAPSDLVARYGPTRSFGRREGELVSAISIRIPLEIAYAEANNLSIKLGGVLLVGLMSLFAVHTFVARRYLLGPLGDISRVAGDIASDERKLGEEIPVPEGRELATVATAFNAMSASLANYRDHMERNVGERTLQYKEANRALVEEVELRKAVERGLRETKAILQAAMDQSQAGIAIADAPSGTLRYVNDAGLLIRGGDRQTVVNGVGIDRYVASWQLLDLDGSPMKPDEVPLARAIMFGETCGREFIIRRAIDDDRVVMAKAAPIMDDDGKVAAGIVVFIDITERKRAEEERLNLERQVQRAQKMESLGMMAGGIAHDFNNILMAVLGHAELALDGISPMSPARDNLTEITTAARRAADLCRQMLAYAGKASFALERVGMRELVEEMAHLLKATISKKAILNLNLERGLPPVQADSSQVRQIVMNLIINASEAIGDRSGVITVSVGATRCDAEYLQKTELRDDLAPGLYVHLEVTDTGAGMDAETRARIFEPFFSTKFTGRGLGLAAVLGIVRAHKGAIKVYSEPGKGTTFKVLFPALEDVSERARPDGLSPLAGWRGKGTILLVDDEESLIALGARMLEHLGFTVLTAADGRQAVDLYRERGKDIDLVLMDLTMPHMDGAAAFGQLRRMNPDIRVVLASGYSQEDVASRFAGKGLAGIMQKPYTLVTLRETLAGLMPARSTGDG